MNGRGLRPGNINSELEILRYVEKQSFDAYIWQIIETKQKFISQLFAGSKEIRSMSDIDNTTMNFAEIKAIATDNKEIMEKFEVDMKVQALKLKERNYKNQRYTFEDKLKISLPKQIETSKNNIEKWKADLLIRNNETPTEFSIELNSRIFKDPKEAGQEIINSVKKNIDKDVLYEIGKYKGFRLCLCNKYNDTEIYLVGNDKYSVNLAQVPSLNVQRLDEKLANIEKYIENAEQNIKNYKREMEQCKVELEKPFTEEQELKELLQRQSELNNKLNLDNKKDEQTLIADEVENQENEYSQDSEEMEE